jgi:hypothetical protein
MFSLVIWSSRTVENCSLISFVVLTSLGMFSGSRGTHKFQFLTFLKGPVPVKFQFLFVSNMGPGSEFFLNFQVLPIPVLREITLSSNIQNIKMDNEKKKLKKS